jgi:hypothetical protein
VRAKGLYIVVFVCTLARETSLNIAQQRGIPTGDQARGKEKQKRGKSERRSQWGDIGKLWEAERGSQYSTDQRVLDKTKRETSKGPCTLCVNQVHDARQR